MSDATTGESGERLQVHLDVKRFQALLHALIQRNFFYVDSSSSSSEGTSNESIVRELYLRQPSQVAADADEEALETEITQFEKVIEGCCISFSISSPDSYLLSTLR